MNALSLQLSTSLIAGPELTEGECPEFNVEVQVTDDALYVKTNGREAWLEVNEHGDLIIHAYEEGAEEPVSVHIRKDRIDIDTDRQWGHQ